MSKNRVRHVLALLAFVGSALLGSAGPAVAHNDAHNDAHNELIGSDPSDGVQVASAPARVSLTFNLPVQRGFSSVTVTGPDGNQWQAGSATEDGAVVSAPVRPLGPAGQYTIAYQVLSADGHPVRGAVRFTLTTAGTGTAGTGTAGTGTATGTGTAGDTGAGSAAEPAPIVDRPGIGTPEAATQAGSAQVESGAESGSAPVWPWLAGVGVLLTAGVAVALRVRAAARRQ